MRLLSSYDVGQICGGGVLCDIQVRVWGVGFGLAAGAFVGTAANALLGVTIGSIIVGLSVAFGPEALCRGRHADPSRSAQ